MSKHECYRCGNADVECEDIRDLGRGLECPECGRDFTMLAGTYGYLADAIRDLRLANGWSQRELAKRLRTKQETISRWENPGYGRYTLKTLHDIARVFNVEFRVSLAPYEETEWETVGRDE